MTAIVVNPPPDFVLPQRSVAIVVFGDDDSALGVQSVVAGDGIAVDDTDPPNPVVSATGGGSGLVDIPISTDESDWDNTAGAWVFNGDGTVTSTAVNGEMTLPLPAEIAGIVMASRFTFKVDVLAAGADIDAYMLGGSNVIFFELEITDGGPPHFLIPGSPFMAVFPGAVISAAGTFLTNTAGNAGVLSIDGVPVIAAARNTPPIDPPPAAPSVDLDESPQLLRLFSNGVAGSVVDLAGCSLQVASVA